MVKMATETRYAHPLAEFAPMPERSYPSWGDTLWSLCTCSAWRYVFMLVQIACQLTVACYDFIITPLPFSLSRIFLTLSYHSSLSTHHLIVLFGNAVFKMSFRANKIFEFMSLTIELQFFIFMVVLVLSGGDTVHLDAYLPIGCLIMVIPLTQLVIMLTLDCGNLSKEGATSPITERGRTVSLSSESVVFSDEEAGLGEDGRAVELTISNTVTVADSEETIQSRSNGVDAITNILENLVVTVDDDMNLPRPLLVPPFRERSGRKVGKYSVKVGETASADNSGSSNLRFPVAKVGESALAENLKSSDTGRVSVAKVAASASAENSGSSSIGRFSVAKVGGSALAENLKSSDTGRVSVAKVVASASAENSGSSNAGRLSVSAKNSVTSDVLKLAEDNLELRQTGAIPKSRRRGSPQSVESTTQTNNDSAATRMRSTLKSLERLDEDIVASNTVETEHNGSRSVYVTRFNDISESNNSFGESFIEFPLDNFEWDGKFEVECLGSPAIITTRKTLIVTQMYLTKNPKVLSKFEENSCITVT